MLRWVVSGAFHTFLGITTSLVSQKIELFLFTFFSRPVFFHSAISSRNVILRRFLFIFENCQQSVTNSWLFWAYGFFCDGLAIKNSSASRVGLLLFTFHFQISTRQFPGISKGGGEWKIFRIDPIKVPWLFYARRVGKMDSMDFMPAMCQPFFMIWLSLLLGPTLCPLLC